MKPIIGIIGPRCYDKDNPFKNKTTFNDNFSKRIVEAGGIPIGILFPFEKFNEDLLNLCDGLIFQGGPHLGSSHICAMHYAYKHKIPVLGICLGMQTMAGYEWYLKKFPNELSYEQIEKNFKYEDEKEYLYDKDGHDNLNLFNINKIDMCKHEVVLSKNSKLCNIFKNKIIDMPSLHKSVVKEDLFKDSIFNATGYTKDGIIEVLESKNGLMIGVQFHPELEDKNLILFKEFINMCKFDKKTINTYNITHKK